MKKVLLVLAFAITFSVNAQISHQNTNNSGMYATALGIGSSATGNYSFSAGYSSDATGDSSSVIKIK